jgi:hypothetical protein
MGLCKKYEVSVKRRERTSAGSRELRACLADMICGGATKRWDGSMTHADDFAPDQLIGKRVTFKSGDEHASCWHTQVGLKTGVVVKVGQSLAQKAELLGPDAEIPEELLAPEADVPRLWVKVEPGGLFPRGCEAAIEKDCLLLLDP